MIINEFGLTHGYHHAIVELTSVGHAQCDGLIPVNNYHAIINYA